MAEPDELYTLRAQYALGHYDSCLVESKQLERRTLSPELNTERQEYVVRAQTALQQYGSITESSEPGLQALYLKAMYEKTQQTSFVDTLKSLASTEPDNVCVQLTCAQVCASLGELSTAFSHVETCKIPEQYGCKIQVLLQHYRLDAAKVQLQKLQQQFEESVIAELCQVYIQLAEGSSRAEDAEHNLNQLSEQYGPSVYLLNLMSVAQSLQGDYSAAETKLTQALKDFPEHPPMADTLINLIGVCCHLNKPYDAYVQQLSTMAATSKAAKEFLEGLNRVQTAYGREALKYKV